MTVFRNVYEFAGEQYVGVCHDSREEAASRAELAASRGVRRIALIREHRKHFIELEPVWL